MSQSPSFPPGWLICKAARNSPFRLLFKTYARLRKERRTKLAYVLGPILMLSVPGPAVAQDVLQPKYPRSFNCANVPAGSQREAGRQSQLSPAIDNDVDKDRSTAGAKPEIPGTVSPATLPDQRGNSGPGTEGGAGDVGN
jgi:hypothetical protein